MKTVKAITLILPSQAGATALEFALVAPVFVLFLMGAFDIAHTQYMTAVLRGIVQKTGRDSSLENATKISQQSLIDAEVTKQVRQLYNTAEVSFKRRSFENYTQAAAQEPEKWTDTNKNLTCDAGEPFVDDNNSGYWDSDGGSDGQGGAKDRVIYTVTVTYPAIVPISRFIGGSPTHTVVATTILQNQPYSDQQATNYSTVRNCP